MWEIFGRQEEANETVVEVSISVYALYIVAHLFSIFVHVFVSVWYVIVCVGVCMC